jgi:hypothetical protein
MPSQNEPKRRTQEKTRIVSERPNGLSEKTTEAVGPFCAQLDRILDWVEELRNRDDESRAERVARLRADGKIPKVTAGYMHTVLKAEHDHETTRIAWAAVMQWAKAQGCLVAQ